MQTLPWISRVSRSICSASFVFCWVSAVFDSSRARSCSPCLVAISSRSMLACASASRCLASASARTFVAIGLAGLSEPDQRRGVGGLEREREVEQNG